MQSLKTQLCYIIYKILLALNRTPSAGFCCPLLVKIMAVSSTRIPFDTVATYNDKRNNNTVNIALHRISPPKQTPSAVVASNSRPMSSSISMASSFSSSSTVSSVNMLINNNGLNHLVLLDIKLRHQGELFSNIKQISLTPLVLIRLGTNLKILNLELPKH